MTPYLYLGIDPGLTGALCAITLTPSPATAPLGCTVWPTPTEWSRINKKPRRIYHLTGMCELLTSFEHVMLTLIERQGPRPRDGTSASFRTGYGYAAWLTLLTAFRIPFRVIEPRTWRKTLGIPPLPGAAGKRAVRDVVQRRLPAAHLTLDTADAVALALVAMTLEAPPRDALP